MSDFVPFELQVEIIKKLPVKSLIRFRSVSKAWKSLIDSSEFIVHHSVHPTDPEHLLVWYKFVVCTEEDRLVNAEKFVCFADDDTFFRQTFSQTIPKLIDKLCNPIIVGSCHGLFCLFGSYHFQDGSGPIFVAAVWNPSIRKSFAVLFPYSLDWPLETRLGFGVCPGTGDPKIVKITHIKKWPELDSLPSIPGQVKVFTLSSGVWRSQSRNLPRKSIEFIWSQVVSDGCIYWLANDRLPGSYGSCNLIMSFDLTSEEFKEISLPDRLALNIPGDIALSISKLRESLVVIEGHECHQCDYDDGYGVWIMEDGVQKLFTKRFTITPPDASIKAVLGFRKSGEPLVKIQDEYDGYMGKAALAIFEPCSRHITALGVDGIEYSFFANFYMETLLLVNHPEFLIYSDDEDNS